jgi:hypothetical protein
VFGLRPVLDRQPDVDGNGTLHHVGREAEMNRSRPAAESGPEKMAGHVGHFFGTHEHDAGLRGGFIEVHDVDAERRAFLGGSFAKGAGGDLSGEDEDGNGIAISAGEPGERVGGAGAGGGAAEAETAAHARITVRHERGALFVAGQDRADPAAVEEGLVQRHERAPRNPENVGDPFSFEVPQQQLDG